MASFYIPLTGLNADSTALNTIANDLSNMNTTAFKAQSTNFSTLFSQQIGNSGSGDAIQVGSGVQVAANATDFSQGSINSTGVSTDAAVNGNGFFVVNGGGTNFFTRAGDFSLASNGDLVTSDGLNVMGYPAVNGVVNTNTALAGINIPENQVQVPSATTTFGMTAILDSAATVGASVPAQVQVYDSLGKSYEATITYAKTGTNAWSYGIALPDTLTPTPAVAATVSNTLTQSSVAAAGTTTLSYNFSSSGGNLATVDPATATTLQITGPLAVGVGTASTALPLVFSHNPETVADLANDLNAAINAAGIAQAGVNAVKVTATANGQLSIVGPTATLALAGAVKQDLAGTTVSYDFGSSGGTLGNVDPGTNLTITGPTATGGTATLSAPAIAPGTTPAAYVAQLTAALAAAGITGVTVTGPTATGQVSITSLATSGSVIQDAVPSVNATGALTFDSSGNLLTPASNVGGITFGGLSDGAAPMNMTWDVLGSSGKPTINQVDAASAVSATTQNGYGTGEYQSFSIGSDGTVTATFSNGQKLNVGQLALANVANLQGLQALGNSEYGTTLASGTASIGTSGTNGLGTLEGASVEESNVNISAEFSDLIIAQRGFEANSKAVTTFDTITQETINMIH